MDLIKSIPLPLLVIDLEATCWDGPVPGQDRTQVLADMEVIEIGCAILGPNHSITASKSFIAKPVRQPTLSSFCTALTGITQDMVEDAPVIEDALKDLQSWLDQIPDRPVVWGSWGNFDAQLLEQEVDPDVLAKALPAEHINLKKVWKKEQKQRKHNSLGCALRHHSLEFEGQPHRGIDDAINVCRVLQKNLG